MNFKDLINSNKQNVRNIIKLITRETNEDLEQEVFVRVWKNQDKYVEKGNFKTWICTIAKNISKDYLKSSAKKHKNNSTSEEVVVNSIADTKSTPELTLISKIRQKKIIEAIDSLKPKFKEVIMLCDIEGFTYEETAKKLNVPVGTVKSRIYNAKKELAEKLRDLL
ncbi:MAG: sigma-70 family RNA polymerase sigma factor [Candidatus Gastranaerophilales bacterium]|nr:sigma-70 family RNA polymerase sigma factor [Candidatus Gastranaerophilales bacterium]